MSSEETTTMTKPATENVAPATDTPTTEAPAKPRRGRPRKVVAKAADETPSTDMKTLKRNPLNAVADQKK